MQQNKQIQLLDDINKYIERRFTAIQQALQTYTESVLSLNRIHANSMTTSNSKLMHSSFKTTSKNTKTKTKNLKIRPPKEHTKYTSIDTTNNSRKQRPALPNSNHIKKKKSNQLKTHSISVKWIEYKSNNLE